MKTVFHQTIDSKQVVIGFAEAFGLIDPRATAIKIAPLLAALPEGQALAAKNAEINARRQEAGQAYGLAERARQQGDAAAMTRQNAVYQSKLAELEDLDTQLVPLVAAFNAASAGVWAENAVYFHPPAGETLTPDDQAADLQAKHAARGDGRALLMTGEYITDLRGRDFYLPGPPWAHKVIDTLGEELPADALTPDALTDAQRAEIAGEAEAARVAGLSPEDRAMEVEKATAAALSQAAARRSELEISGAKDALAQSQAQYADAVEAIAEKYGE